MSFKSLLRLCEKSLKIRGSIFLGFILGCMFTYIILPHDLSKVSQYSVLKNTDVAVNAGRKLSQANIVSSETESGNNTKNVPLVIQQQQQQQIQQSRLHQPHNVLPPRVAPSRLSNQQKLSSVPKYTFREFKDRVKVNSTLRDRVFSQEYLLPETTAVLRRYLLDEPYTFKYDDALKANLQQNFDINTDVIVFLHIQKTGGMHFNDRINRELQVPFRCKRRVTAPKSPGNCLNPSNNMWFYNTAYSGWQCGLHADWTQMHKCIPGLMDKIEQKQRPRRYFYFTQIRDAMERYLSEYHHQTAHNHWQQALLGCETLKNANDIDVIPCFRTRNWIGVSLEQFIACKNNLATQRMTRMLADLTLAGCYKNFTDVDAIKMRAPIWLESAKRNLQSMEFIALMEDEPASDALFNKTYKLAFKRRVITPAKKPGPGGDTMKISEEHFIRILQLAELDIHLYLFTKDLFYDRLKHIQDA
ncbi:Hs6st1p [Mactra antiquata]